MKDNSRIKERLSEHAQECLFLSSSLQWYKDSTHVILVAWKVEHTFCGWSQTKYNRFTNVRKLEVLLEGNSPNKYQLQNLSLEVNRSALFSFGFEPIHSAVATPEFQHLVRAVIWSTP